MEDSNKEITELLQRKGIRATANRIIVMRTLMHSRHPMSIADIEQKLLTLDKSSIFRALTLFREHDAVHVIDDGTGALKYEVCYGDDAHLSHLHVHFHCEVCQKTFCMEDIRIPMVDLPKDFIIHSASYTIKGTCPQCAERL